MKAKITYKKKHYNDSGFEKISFVKEVKNEEELSIIKKSLIVQGNVFNVSSIYMPDNYSATKKGDIPNEGQIAISKLN